MSFKPEQASASSQSSYSGSQLLACDLKLVACRFPERNLDEFGIRSPIVHPTLRPPWVVRVGSVSGGRAGSRPSRRRASSLKQIIYDGLAAMAGGVARERAGILVDEQFGADILRARRGWLHDGCSRGKERPERVRLRVRRRLRRPHRRIRSDSTGPLSGTCPTSAGSWRPARALLQRPPASYGPIQRRTAQAASSPGNRPRGLPGPATRPGRRRHSRVPARCLNSENDVFGKVKCLDRMLITGERHLRLILSEYAGYYNLHRPHRALHQSPPAGCPHPPALGANVRVLRRDRLGGLIRECSQVA